MRATGKTAAVLIVVLTYATLTGCSLLTPPGSDGPGTVPGTDPATGAMAADVIILDDPAGGKGVTDLACVFEATQLGTSGAAPIQIRVDWSASCGTHKSETFTFRGGQEVFTSTYEDPSGYPLGMTFWATIRWTDSRGSHVLQSADAACKI